MLREMIQTLDSREQVILRLRFGLEGESPKTLDEIGEELGLSSERVRQVQKAALEKLRRRIKNLENSGSHFRSTNFGPFDFMTPAEIGPSAC